MPDFNAQLASHATIIRHLPALRVTMATAIHALKDDHRTGGAHA